jgi:hypothetical protein
LQYVGGAFFGVDQILDGMLQPLLPFLIRHWDAIFPIRGKEKDHISQDFQCEEDFSLHRSTLLKHCKIIIQIDHSRVVDSDWFNPDQYPDLDPAFVLNPDPQNFWNRIQCGSGSGSTIENLKTTFFGSPKINIKVKNTCSLYYFLPFSYKNV